MQKSKSEKPSQVLNIPIVQIFAVHKLNDNGAFEIKFGDEAHQEVNIN
jgi:hypothetical protein